MQPLNFSLSRSTKSIRTKTPAMAEKIGTVFVMCPFALIAWYVIAKGAPYGSLWMRRHLHDVAAFREGVDLGNNSRAGLALEGYMSPAEKTHDKYLGGLLFPGFNESSCLSRYQSSLYRKGQPWQPSSHLISRLRNYEALHKRCGPHTEAYKKALENLKSGQETSSSDCKYVIPIPVGGLGNRMLSFTSAFLYALLTSRVLLVDSRNTIPELFCEPFPEVSWLLPHDFPLVHQFTSFKQGYSHSYGNMLKRNAIGYSNVSTLPPYMYLYLKGDYDDSDKLFFCDQDQTIIQKVTWLILQSDHYFVPPLFLIPSFEKELNYLFPEKEAIFHHLGRYLFHPTNYIWGLITRYYESYLARANERIGIQVRVFGSGNNKGPLIHVTDQILACTMKENLLPQTSNEQPIIKPSGKQKTIAILVTSLGSGYFEKLRDMYWEYASVSGDIIAVFQPSHEGRQKYGSMQHDRKAWAEIYLLSLSDKLVTSGVSTFGYVAQGLGGLRPWILYKPEGGVAPNPPCLRAVSMEPCFHYSEYFYACKEKNGINFLHHVPYLQQCEDRIWGLKLVDRDQ